MCTGICLLPRDFFGTGPKGGNALSAFHRFRLGSYDRAVRVAQVAEVCIQMPSADTPRVQWETREPYEAERR